MGKPKLLFYTHGLVDGGGERLWACLASAFHKHGYEVMFAQDFAASDNRDHVDPAIPITTLGRGHITAIHQLAQLIRNERPDVALAAIGGSNLKLLIAKLLARVPLQTIISFHGAEEWRSGWLSYFTYLGLPILSRYADRTVCVSAGLSDDLAKTWRAFAPRQRTIHNPVYFPRGAPVPTAQELAQRDDLILSAGRLVPEKDFACLLRAFQHLNRPSARLVIIGKGPEKERLEALSRNLGLDERVSFPGYLADPWAMYAKAKCFALSSRSEQFGNVIVEALAHGLPIVATAATGPKEILAGGSHGYLVPIGDDVALAGALGSALDDAGCPQARRKRAEVFSFAARLPAYEALILDVHTQSNRLLTRVYLDLTHLGRHVTGIERISIEQFEKQPFQGAEVRPVRSRSIVSMIAKQQILLPLLALSHPRALFVFPGFPPSPWFLLARQRTLLYVHDLFLMTRRQDLGLKAKLYMALPFRWAISKLKYFMVNSEKTRSELLQASSPDASVVLYRPVVRNVFGLSADGRAGRPSRPRPLKIVMVGTIEPRKNTIAAQAIRTALGEHGFGNAELHLIGRPGWGNALEALRADTHVRLHGYLPLDEARRVIEAADLYLCTSHDEGLGLPLIEAQFAGLPVIAPESAVFREVLGTSGLFIDPSNEKAAARAIAGLISTPQWRSVSAKAAMENAHRWNSLAGRDLEQAKGLFARRLDETMAPGRVRVA